MSRPALRIEKHGGPPAAAHAAALGDHPAVFAISVVNEIPPELVRFMGNERVEAFIEAVTEHKRWPDFHLDAEAQAVGLTVDAPCDEHGNAR